MSSGGPEPSKEIASEPIERLTGWLETTLGARTAGYAADVDADLVSRVARGEERPDAEAESRLRNLYAVVWFLSSQEGPESAYEWLLNPHPELDDHTPVEHLRRGDGGGQEDVWFAASPDLDDKQQ